MHNFIRIENKCSIQFFYLRRVSSGHDFGPNKVRMVRLIRIGPLNTEHQNDTISHCSVGILIKITGS